MNIDNSAIISHLREMKNVYDETLNMTSIELYAYFLNLEENYCNSRTISSFAYTVHRLHPVYYAEDWYNLLIS